MITDDQFKAWLKSDCPYRNVLLECTPKSNGVDNPLYLSQKNYRDTTSGISYLAIISGGLQFTEDLGVNGSASMAYGDITMQNSNGEFDDALNWIWRNKPVKILIGDISWARTDYRVMLDGVMDDLIPSGSNKLSIRVRDKLQRLNTRLSETKLGGTTDNKEQLLPITLGECCNVTPLLVDPATVTYQVSIGAIEDIIECRDNGLPITITKDLANGKFSLPNGKPVGALTASVQGLKIGTYVNDIANLIKHIAQYAGKPGTQFTDADIDLTNFTAFSTSYPQAVGYYVNAGENSIAVMQELAASIDARVMISRTGKLTLKQLAAPTGSATRTITADDMRENSFMPGEKIPLRAGIVLNYCKNWTVQKELKSAIPPEHKSLFADEWQTQQVKNDTIATDYNEHVTPEPLTSYLINATEALAEANRRLAFYSTPITLYQFTGNFGCFDLTLGQEITVVHQRFGFSAGKNVIVSKLVTDWFAGTVKVEAYS